MDGGKTKELRTSDMPYCIT